MFNVNGGDKTYVADANGLGLARLEGCLHLFPAIGMVVVPDNVSLAVGQGRELVVVTCPCIELDYLNPLFLKANRDSFSYHRGSAEPASAIATHIRQHTCRSCIYIYAHIDLLTTSSRST